MAARANARQSSPGATICPVRGCGETPKRRGCAIVLLRKTREAFASRASLRFYRGEPDLRSIIIDRQELNRFMIEQCGVMCEGVR